ncbi:unnamed protein product, partial [Rotaria magnacalcarata]
SSSSSSSSSSTTISTNPALWTIDQVEEWLKTNNFDDCVDILCHQSHTDGKRLVKLNQNDILSLTNNKQLWLKIKSLKSKSKQSIAIQLEPHNINCQRHTSSNEIEDQPFTHCCFVTSIRSDRKKTLLAFLLAFMTILFSSFIITIVDERIPDPKSFPPLPDLILDNIQQIPWAFAVTEKLILIEMATLIIVILAHRHRF